ncbi:MAG: META domain-containing protein, partial [Candidatus Limnocylindrales bacterium]
LLDEVGAVRVVLARSRDADVSGDWAVTRYARANGKPAEPLADQPIFVTFGEDGRLGGSSGCRLLGGLYTSQADQVVIAPVETTGLPCDGDVKAQERRLLRIFEQVVFWQRQGERLVLADASGAPLLELVAVEGSPEAEPSELPAESGG